LLDGRSRKFVSLSRPEEFIVAQGKDGIGLGDSLSALVVVRLRELDGRQDLVSSPYPLQVLGSPDATSKPEQIDVLSLAGSEKPTGSEELHGYWITVEDRRDETPLTAEMKIDDYRYGAFDVPVDSEVFYAFPPKTDNEAPLSKWSFRLGPRRFQVIMLDPSVEAIEE
jgi:hypothetical protein